MVLVLFFCLIFVLAIFSLKVTIELNKIEISNKNKNANIIIKLYIFEIIKVFQKILNINITGKSKKIDKIKRMLLNQKRKNTNYIKNSAKNLDIELKEINFSLNIGTEDPILTSFLVCTIASIVSIIIGSIVKKIDTNKYKYKILPVYNNENTINFSLFGIVEIKLVKIIKVLIKLWSDKNDKRPSNRKFNDKCNEQYRANDRCEYYCRGTNRNGKWHINNSNIKS